MYNIVFNAIFAREKITRWIELSLSDLGLKYSEIHSHYEILFINQYHVT